MPVREYHMRKIFSRYGFYGALTFFILFSASPFYIMLVTMFKRTHDLFNPNNNPFFFTELPTLDHLKLLFSQTLFTTFLLNTLLVGIAVVVITVLLAVPAAFSIARMAGRWGESIGIGIFLTYLVPPTLLFIPLSRIVSILGLQNSLWSLILVYLYGPVLYLALDEFLQVHSQGHRGAGPDRWLQQAWRLL
jgi:multiple sugar transport system permease protein